MQNEQNSIELAQKFKRIKDAYSASHQYIHPNTIDNFIYHFDKFPVNIKPEVYKALIAYLDYINDTNITNAKEAQQTFQKYLSNTASLYVRLLGFHIYIRPRLLLFFASIIILILYFVSISVFYYLVVIILVMAIFIRQYYYKRQKKVFCPMY